MAARMCEDGVTVTFLDESGGDQRRKSVFGEYAFFFSQPRPVAPGNPDPIHGSQDWLTDVVVVDNPVKLANLLPSQYGIEGGGTSASSQNVLLRWDIGSDQGSDRCLTICLGEHRGNRIFTKEILALPEGTKMTKDHKLFEKWVHGAKV